MRGRSQARSGPFPGIRCNNNRMIARTLTESGRPRHEAGIRENTVISFISPISITLLGTLSPAGPDTGTDTRDRLSRDRDLTPAGRLDRFGRNARARFRCPTTREDRSPRCTAGLRGTRRIPTPGRPRGRADPHRDRTVRRGQRDRTGHRGRSPGTRDSRHALPWRRSDRRTGQRGLLRLHRSRRRRLDQERRRSLLHQ